MKTIFELITLIFQSLFDLICIILTPEGNNKLYDNGQMSAKDRRKQFSRWNKGLVIRGKKRLTKKQSLSHVALVGASGRGKTSSYYALQLIRASTQNFVVVDVDGGMYKSCSGYLKKQGYDIQVLNLDQVTQSVFYNPLEHVKTDDDLKALCETLILSSEASKGSGDQFWQYSSIHLLYLITRIQKCLPSQYNTLANLRHLLTQIESKEFAQLVSEHVEIDLWNEFLAFKSKDSKLRSNIISSLSATIDLFSYSELSHISSKNTLDFSRLTKSKAVLFLIVPERKLQRSALLLSLLFFHLFEYVQAHKPKEPLYFLLDECGNYFIKNLEVLISILRRYNCSLSLGFQDINQARRLYTPESAKTILNNCSTKIVFAGASLELAQRISNLAGQKSVTIEVDGRKRDMIKPVLEPTEIIQMANREAVVLVSNLPPAILKLTPWYTQFRLKRRARIPPAKLKTSPMINPPLIPLFNTPNTQQHDQEGFDLEELTNEDI